MTGDNRNFLLAVILSAAIIFGWQFFYAGPRQEKIQQDLAAQQQAQSTSVNVAAQPSAGNNVSAGNVSAPSSAGEVFLPREQALTTSPRIQIDTPQLSGSINLLGARIDDLHLKGYRETVDATSPTITLLSPGNSADGFFAEDGYVAAPGNLVKLPDAKSLWQAPQGSVLSPNNPVTLTWDNGEGLVFSKTIAVDADYLFTITQKVANNTSAPVALLEYARLKRNGIPVTANIYVLHEGLIGVADGQLTELKYSALKEDKPVVETSSTGGWLGFTDKYWAAALIPARDLQVKSTYRHQMSNGLDSFQADYIAANPSVINAGESLVQESRLFAGAKVVQIIDRYDTQYGIDQFELMIDWGWFYFITKPLFWLLEFLKGLTGNFGLAIILATVIIKAAFFPLANKSYASMSKMKKLQPEMERLKQAYPDDRMKQQQELMELYKKEKVSPMSGCLPMLVQIPVFFALYKVIYVTIEMRHAPFYGWIHDLSAADPSNVFNLFGLISWAPPSFLWLGAWPLVMGVTMWIQMRLNPAPQDPVQAQLFNWMPVLFTFMLANFPAGLVIYWAWNNTLSVLQQAFIMKRQGVEVNLLGNIRNSLPFLKSKG